jgi:cell wall-associated NlpC family hydrolase
MQTLNGHFGLADYRLALARIPVAERPTKCTRMHPSLTAAAGQSQHPLEASVPARDIAPDLGDAISAWNGLAAALTRSPARFTKSALDAARADVARDIVADAACLALSHAHEIRYVRGARRWEGIDRGLRASRGEYPRHADCSSFASWVLWQALSHFGLGDTINGTNWQAGYVGTLLEHGRPVARHDARVGDLAFYQPDDSDHRHVAVCIGADLVISHGNDDGPRLLSLDYRRDMRSIRRYI